MDTCAASYMEYQKLCKAINACADLEKFFIKHEKFSLPILDLRMFEPGDPSPELMAAFDALETFCQERLIAPKGGNSNVFYSLQKYGVVTRVLESDSFGPLECLVEDDTKKWCYTYG